MSFEFPRGLSAVNTRTLASFVYLQGMKRFAWSPDGNALAIPCHDGSIDVWQVRSDKSQLLTGHSALVSSVGWHPYNNQLASASDDRTVRIWDLDDSDGQCKTLAGHTDYVTSLAWSSRAELASSSDDGTVRRWDWQRSMKAETLISHRDRVLDVAWSPDGKILTSASWDQQLGFWESGTGVQKKLGHASRIFCVRWSPTPPGRLIASGDQDGMVFLWSRSGKVLNRFYAHRSAVLSLSFSPDGLYLISRDQETAKIWRITDAMEVPQEIASFVCRGNPPYVAVAFDPVAMPHRVAASIGVSDETLIILEADYNAMVNRRIFIVHGRDDDAVQAVKAYLYENELEPVSLREQPDSKLSFVMEKFKLYSDVAFAIVLLTPDDIGYLATSETRTDNSREAGHTAIHPAVSNRARQNVILELGYFIGRLGYEKVCLLQKGNIEFPSDLSGVVYIEMDREGAWKATLKERLQRSGLTLGR